MADVDGGISAWTGKGFRCRQVELAVRSPRSSPPSGRPARRRRRLLVGTEPNDVLAASASPSSIGDVLARCHRCRRRGPQRRPSWPARSPMSDVGRPTASGMAGRRVGGRPSCRSPPSSPVDATFDLGVAR
ncbi:MAG: hypothetical protein R2710_05605 [Acidimicrobiales bacterium]